VAETQGEAECGASVEEAWSFIRDFENWITEFQGYDGHEVSDDASITLRMRGKVGPMSKVTRLRIVITGERPPHHLTFSMTGTTDPLVGDGQLDVTPASGSGARVAYRVRLNARGIAAPVLDEFLLKVVPQTVGDLSRRIADRLDTAAAGA
jgi:carbon monoxide dehydrogenase subunit G